jgi:transposase-like protein/IS1 family transposase
MQVKVYSCIKCVGDDFIKYGKTNYGKQRYQCKFCKAISVLQYSYNAYKEDINTKVIQLTKEGMGIRSIARILKISTTTLLKRIVAIANSISQPLIPYYQTYELDEMRFFIRKKSNVMWLVYAINKSTKEIAGFYIGRRNNKTLNAVIKTLINSKTKKIYTDKLRNYQYLIPKEIHSTKKIRNQRNRKEKP